MWVCTCVCIYIYLYMCACSPPQNPPKQHFHRYTRKKTSFLPTIYSMFYFLEHKNRTYISIYLSIDLSIYLSIYLNIDKFNIYIYIHMYVHPPRIHQNSIFTCICEEKSVLPTIYSTTTVSTGIFILYMRKMLLQ